MRRLASMCLVVLLRGWGAGNGAGGYAEEQKWVLSLNYVLVLADCLGFLGMYLSVNGQ